MTHVGHRVIVVTIARHWYVRVAIDGSKTYLNNTPYIHEVVNKSARARKLGSWFDYTNMQEHGAQQKAQKAQKADTKLCE